MSRAKIAVVIACSMIGSAAQGAVVVYQFSGPLLTNSMSSGGFAGAPIGAPVTLEIAVETSNAPIFSAPGRNHWDTVAGTILGLKATVNGFTSIATPNSAPLYARVVNDANNSGTYIDQFWIEALGIGATPDFKSGSAVLSTVGAAPPISSSLIGTDFPTDSSELIASSFLNEHYILLKGDPGQFLRADITSMSVVPAPGVGVLFVGAGLASVRRRR